MLLAYRQKHNTRTLGFIRDDNDRIRIQEELNLIYEWAEINNMKCNGKKFEAMKYGNRETNYTSPLHQPDGEPIKVVEELILKRSGDSSIFQGIFCLAHFTNEFRM